MARVLDPLTVRQGVRELARLRREGALRERASQLFNEAKSPSSLGGRAALNSGWLVGEQLIRMAATFFVTVLIIRHLGPGDYGILAYGVALILIIDVVGTLGMRSVLVRELVDHPDEEPEILGTAVMMRLLGSLLVAAAAIALVWSLDTDVRTLAVILVLSLSLPIWSLTALELAFQATLQSQYAVYARLAGLAVAMGLRLVLLALGAPLLAFAVATTVEFVATGVFFAAVYERKRLPLRTFRVTGQMARRLLGLSWPLFISAFAAMVYLKVDQFMLMHFIDATEVGLYAAGARISEIWYIIPIAVAGSLLPVFVARHNEGVAPYHAALQRGFDVTFWLALALAVTVTVAAPLVVFLYGADFERTVDILRIHVWATPFIFMSSILSRALVTEDRRKFELTRHSSGAVLNVLLNLLLIPPFGGLGAATATVVSYTFSSYLICFGYRPTWTHARLMTRALTLPFRTRGSAEVHSQSTRQDEFRQPPPRPYEHRVTTDDARHAPARSDTNHGLRVAPAEVSPEDSEPCASIEELEIPAVTEPSRLYFALKRTVDVVAAGALLLLLAPLMLTLAVAIKATSPGPIFFAHERCGLRARPFYVLKFRSMRRDAESRKHEVRALDVTNGPTFKSPVDPRVTAVGRIMRRYSLDELPQLWHVLTGDMSLVGPRPLVTQETLQLPSWALARLAVKPGLTCIWQVSGRSLIPFEEWMQLDLEYVRSRSLWLDLKLLVKTPAAVLTGRGAF